MAHHVLWSSPRSSPIKRDFSLQPRGRHATNPRGAPALKNPLRKNSNHGRGTRFSLSRTLAAKRNLPRLPQTPEQKKIPARRRGVSPFSDPRRQPRSRRKKRHASTKFCRWGQLKYECPVQFFTEIRPSPRKRSRRDRPFFEAARPRGA